MFNSHSASLHPGVQMVTGKLNAVGNLAKTTNHFNLPDLQEKKKQHKNN